MYNLAMDAVITTYNAHYHELMHLLINFKLQDLPLYTHPFFQEGFAVATGGRGGKEPKVILDLGVFITKSELLDYTDLLSRGEFYKVDASFSYPLCGLYNYFLIKHWGIGKYLDLYKGFSGSSSEVNTMIINENILPAKTEWYTYINSQLCSNSIDFKNPEMSTILIFKNESTEVSMSKGRYFFKLKDILFIKTDTCNKDYHSKKFSEIFPEKKYNNEKYLISININEISIYNLFTNNLIGNLVSSFTIPYEQIPEKDGYFSFCVKKSIFDEELKEDYFQ